jgi:hypothetical protein
MKVVILLHFDLNILCLLPEFFTVVGLLKRKRELSVIHINNCAICYKEEWCGKIGFTSPHYPQCFFDILVTINSRLTQNFLVYF